MVNMTRANGCTAGVELAVIDDKTTARQFEKELQLSEMVHRLDNRH